MTNVPENPWREVKLPGGRLRLWPEFLPAGEADQLQQRLSAGLQWQRDSVKLFGREHPIPRQHQWYGDAGMRYRWSGLTMQPLPWTDELAELRERLRAATEITFNSVLANLYRDGNDSMGWHADDEPELGVRPVIASVSLGAERDLLLRRRAGRERGERSVKVCLPHGSLLLMSGATQQNWQHALPRRARISEPRINLTFRRILGERQAATSNPAASMAAASASA
ncbi:MAG: alpha-ketoglutarate-dependent dioxygenase AlkB [Gammaproteobacteria bacterium]|nr:alpha-ketoglutarate-dependent dioxygenase AlkB [Gammaproteobacteria bacterium]NND55364.1 alpha-ketoglutarate-dependent dioxygenase AlkB [Gammaproteobacteria bacterium]